VVGFFDLGYCLIVVAWFDFGFVAFVVRLGCIVGDWFGYLMFGFVAGVLLVLLCWLTCCRLLVRWCGF